MEDDGLWFGCGTVDKAGKLCEKTIELPRSTGLSSCFTVRDLTKDERFNQLPFVTGPPFFKFYAGTPLTTKKGINIGSLFIIDDIVRDVLSEDQEKVLVTLAKTVMNHMEMASEAQERRKVMRLSLGMNAFVEGKKRLDPDDLGSVVGNIAQPDCNGRANVSPRKASEKGTISQGVSPSKNSVQSLKQRELGIRPQFCSTVRPIF